MSPSLNENDRYGRYSAMTSTLDNNQSAYKKAIEENQLAEKLLEDLKASQMRREQAAHKSFEVPLKSIHSQERKQIHQQSVEEPTISRYLRNTNGTPIPEESNVNTSQDFEKSQRLENVNDPLTRLSINEIRNPYELQKVMNIKGEISLNPSWPSQSFAKKGSNEQNLLTSERNKMSKKELSSTQQTPHLRHDFQGPYLEEQFNFGNVLTGEGVISPRQNAPQIEIQDKDDKYSNQKHKQSSQIQTIESKELKERIERIKQDLINEKNQQEEQKFNSEEEQKFSTGYEQKFFTGDMQPNYLTRNQYEYNSQIIPLRSKSKSPRVTAEEPDKSSQVSKLNYQNLNQVSSSFFQPHDSQPHVGQPIRSDSNENSVLSRNKMYDQNKDKDVYMTNEDFQNRNLHREEQSIYERNQEPVHSSQILEQTFKNEMNEIPVVAISMDSHNQLTQLKTNLDTSMVSSMAPQNTIFQALRDRSSKSRSQSPIKRISQPNPKNSSLRNKNSKTSIDRITSGLPPPHSSNKSLHAINNESRKLLAQPTPQSRQVTFNMDSKDQLPTATSSGNLNDIVALDAFYQDLLAKERAQFERMLQSKCNITRNQTTSKLKKQIKNAEDKYEQAQALEKKLKMAKDCNQRLSQEAESYKQSNFTLEAKVKMIEQEKDELKEQLERLWGRTEQEKEIAMIVTKEEMERTSNQQISSLQEQIKSNETEIKDLNQKLLDQNDLLSEIKELENDKLRLKADKEILETKLERLEIDNKRFKQDYDFQHQQKVREMKDQQSLMEQQYNEMRAESDKLKQLHNLSKQDLQKLLTSSQKVNSLVSNSLNLNNTQSNGTHIYIQSSRKSQEQIGSGEINDTFSKQIHENNQNSVTYIQTSKNQSQSPQRQDQKPLQDKSEESAEIWKKRCKDLAGKYFNALKDLKKDLEFFKRSVKQDVKDAQNQVGQSLVNELQQKMMKLQISIPQTIQQSHSNINLQSAPSIIPSASHQTNTQQNSTYFIGRNKDLAMFSFKNTNNYFDAKSSDKMHSIQKEEQNPKYKAIDQSNQQIIDQNQQIKSIRSDPNIQANGIESYPFTPVFQTNEPSTLQQAPDFIHAQYAPKPILTYQQSKHSYQNLNNISNSQSRSNINRNIESARNLSSREQMDIQKDEIINKDLIVHDQSHKQGYPLTENDDEVSSNFVSQFGKKYDQIMTRTFQQSTNPKIASNLPATRIDSEKVKNISTPSSMQKYINFGNIGRYDYQDYINDKRSSHSRDRSLTQIVYIDGVKHMVVPLRSKSNSRSPQSTIQHQILTQNTGFGDKGFSSNSRAQPLLSQISTNQNHYNQISASNIPQPPQQIYRSQVSQRTIPNGYIKSQQSPRTNYAEMSQNSNNMIQLKNVKKQMIDEEYGYKNQFSQLSKKQSQLFNQNPLSNHIQMSGNLGTINETLNDKTISDNNRMVTVSSIPPKEYRHSAKSSSIVQSQGSRKNSYKSEKSMRKSEKSNNSRITSILKKQQYPLRLNNLQSRSNSRSIENIRDKSGKSKRSLSSKSGREINSKNVTTRRSKSRSKSQKGRRQDSGGNINHYEMPRVNSNNNISSMQNTQNTYESANFILSNTHQGESFEAINDQIQQQIKHLKRIGGGTSNQNTDLRNTVDLANNEMISSGFASVKQKKKKSSSKQKKKKSNDVSDKNTKRSIKQSNTTKLNINNQS